VRPCFPRFLRYFLSLFLYLVRQVPSHLGREARARLSIDRRTTSLTSPTPPGGQESAGRIFPPPPPPPPVRRAIFSLFPRDATRLGADSIPPSPRRPAPFSFSRSSTRARVSLTSFPSRVKRRAASRWAPQTILYSRDVSRDRFRLTNLISTNELRWTRNEGLTERMRWRKARFSRDVSWFDVNASVIRANETRCKYNLNWYALRILLSGSLCLDGHDRAYRVVKILILTLQSYTQMLMFASPWGFEQNGKHGLSCKNDGIYVKNTFLLARTVYGIEE